MGGDGEVITKIKIFMNTEFGKWNKLMTVIISVFGIIDRFDDSNFKSYTTKVTELSGVSGLLGFGTMAAIIHSCRFLT